MRQLDFQNEESLYIYDEPLTFPLFDLSSFLRNFPLISLLLCFKVGSPHGHTPMTEKLACCKKDRVGGTLSPGTGETYPNLSFKC